MAQAVTLERIRRDFEAIAEGLPATAAPLETRRHALQELARLGWPNAHDEQWRYANLRAFDQIAQFAPAQPDLNEAANDATGSLALPPALPGFERMVFINGVRTPGRPQATSGRGSWGADQRLGWLGDMFARDALVLRPDARGAIADANGCAIAGAVEVLFVTTPAAAGAGVYPQLQVQVPPGRQLKLVERHLGGADEPTLVSANISIELAAGAQLSHYRVQHSGAQVVFADTLSATLDTDARYVTRQVAIGASTARTSAQVQLSGRGAALDWQSIAVARGEQVLDLLLRVDHRAPGTRTEEVFRGIAEERSRIAFNAHIDICAQAPGSEARQSLRGLIEGERAEIDLRPRLQINTDDVRAQHGATTGQLDENLLFYLLSRGLDAKTARALLKWAFLGDVLKAIDLPALRSAAEHAAADQLPDVMAIGALT